VRRSQQRATAPRKILSTPPRPESRRRRDRSFDIHHRNPPPPPAQRNYAALVEHPLLSASTRNPCGRCEGTTRRKLRRPCVKRPCFSAAMAVGLRPSGRSPDRLGRIREAWSSIDSISVSTSPSRSPKGTSFAELLLEQGARFIPSVWAPEQFRAERAATASYEAPCRGEQTSPWRPVPVQIEKRARGRARACERAARHPRSFSRWLSAVSGSPRQGALAS